MGRGTPITDNDKQCMLQKQKERNDIWLALLCRNTGMHPWILPELHSGVIWRWQMPDYPVGWLSLYKQDGLGKGISWFLEPLPCSTNTWSSEGEYAGFSADGWQIFWNILSLTAKAPLGLVLYIQPLWEAWKLPSVIPTTHDQRISVGKNFGCHLSHHSIWSLSPFYSLIRGHFYLVISRVGYLVMSAASSFHSSVFSVSVGCH